MGDFKKCVRILLVEDSNDDADLVLHHLKRAGYEPIVDRVQTRESLTRALDACLWDLILCDNTMPQFSGAEALELVRRLHPELPFVFFSGRRNGSGRKDPLPEGVTGSLEKGEWSSLAALVGRILSGDSRHSSGVTRAPEPPALRAPGDRPRILIVDDQPGNLLTLEASLEGVEADLVRAGSGQEALAKLLEGDYALILLDVRMPGMDGFETAEIFRKRARTRWVPIIFLTTLMDHPEVVARGYASGCVDYLAKPLVAEVLRAKVGVFLELWKKTLLLERQASDLRAANEGLEAFSGQVAHDLRAPLRAISGFSRILAEDYSGKTLDETGQIYLEKIRQAAGRMDALILDLLVYAHLNLEDLRVGPVDLDGVVDDILSSLVSEVSVSGAQVTVARPLGTVRAHAVMLRQALENLIANALKFTRAGERPEVRVRSEPGKEGRRRLWVEDHGIGIAPSDLGRLFLPFSRLEAAQPYAGTGLGLAIVRRAVERMGGSIGVDSEAGKGSRFYVELPEA